MSPFVAFIAFCDVCGFCGLLCFLTVYIKIIGFPRNEINFNVFVTGVAVMNV